MAVRQRLDQTMVLRRLAPSRSQADSWIKLGKVTVEGRVATKSGQMVSQGAVIELHASETYVSRAGLKLASVSSLLGLSFRGKTVLDVGSSTGGFTDYALQHGAERVVAVDVGTEQLHPSLRGDARIALHEKTDIRDVVAEQSGKHGRVMVATYPDSIVIDVSFISLREILPHIAGSLANKQTQIVCMVKPQFEAGKHQVNKGVIKNDAVRRAILSDFEMWAKRLFIVKGKRDSEVAGAKGNRERFYLLQIL